MLFVLILALAAVGCGKEIGDDCIVSTDCDPTGTRLCDMTTKDGYCTIQGCDYNTCPSEAECVSFFTGEFANRPCDYDTEGLTTFDCSLDELCDLRGYCVPRNAEVRYCMRTCDSDSDCRDGYECRDLNLMMEHGGQPVLAPGLLVDSHTSKFCAAKPAS